MEQELSSTPCCSTTTTTIPPSRKKPKKRVTRHSLSDQTLDGPRGGKFKLLFDSTTKQYKKVYIKPKKKMIREHEELEVQS